MSFTCECGCGEKVTIRRGVPNRFISGHNKPRQKPPAYLTCIHCGMKKQVSPYQNGRPFCSPECRDNYRRARLSIDHPQYKRVEHKCGICGTIFIIAPGRVKRNIRYCSTECGNKARSQKQKKPDDGTRCIASVKKNILDRDQGKCRICGFDVCTHVHHIIPKADKGKHTASNLITLCPNHHAMAHLGLLSKESLLMAIM